MRIETGSQIGTTIVHPTQHRDASNTVGKISNFPDIKKKVAPGGNRSQDLSITG